MGKEWLQRKWLHGYRSAWLEINMVTFAIDLYLEYTEINYPKMIQL